MSAEPVLSKFEETLELLQPLQQGSESEFCSFSQSTEALHRDWVRLKALSKDLRRQVLVEQQQIGSLSDRLKLTQSEVLNQIQESRRAENERNTLEQRVRSIRKLLEDESSLHSLSENERDELTSLTDTSYWLSTSTSATEWLQTTPSTSCSRTQTASTSGEPVANHVASPIRRRLAKLHCYAPSERPCVPAIVACCIKELETRALTSPKLHRSNGPVSEAQALVHTLLSREKATVLQDKPEAVISSALRLFLCEIREPLVTCAKWSEFAALGSEWHMRMAQLGGQFPCGGMYVTLEQRLRVLLSLLPRANRETLALVCLHLLKVRRMQANVRELVDVFGPALVGHSKSALDLGAAQLAAELAVQRHVLGFFLHLDFEFWDVYVDENEALAQNVTRAAKAALFSHNILANSCL